MNRRQESKLSMYLAVRDFLLQNSETTKGLPNFEANFLDLQGTIGKIQSIAEVQKSDTKGFAKEKQRLRDELVSLVLENSYKLHAYASFKGDVKLQSASKITRSKLSSAPDTGVRDYAQIIFDMAEARKEILPEYGITNESQSRMIESIAKYNASLSGPRVAKTENVQATRQLNTLFEHADELVGAISIAIGIIRLAKPLFFKGFETARRIVNASGSSFSLRGMAVDSVNGVTLTGVKFIFTRKRDALAADENPTEIVRKTRGKGTFLIKSIPEGTYAVTVTKPGYKDKVVRVVIANGEMTDLKVEMEAE